MENMNDYAVKINRSEEFNKMADILSQYIIGLNLPTDKNDELISLIIRQINIAEHDSFLQGFDKGVKFMKDNSRHLHCRTFRTP